MSSSRRRFSTQTLLVCVLAMSCAELAPVPVERAAVAPPPDRLSAQTISIPDAAPRPAGMRLLEETKFTLALQDASLSTVLLGLGHESPFNAVIDPKISGTVTADFRNVSMRVILDELLLPRGYHYNVRGNFLRMSSSERTTRTYRVDYPNYARRGNSDLVISGAIATSPDIGAGSSEAGDDSSSTRIQTTQEVDFWAELESSLKVILFGDSSGDSESEDADTLDRRLVVAKQAGLLTVTAEPKVLGQIENFLDEIARSTERQVLIDVRILEVDIGDDLDFGVDWEAAAGLGGSEGTLGRTVKPGLTDAFAISDLAPVLTGGGFLFGIAADEISVLLAALASERNVRVVSTPRIATLNNHKALIKVVRNEIFYVAEVETELVEAVGTTQTVEFVPQVVPVGVTLDITPQISDDGHITMHIHPSISEVVDVVIQPQSNPDLDSVGSLPVIDLRETDTVMRVPDQNTILIGGLIQSREFERHDKIPLLGDIPYLGALFRMTRVEEARTELIILVTPTILDAPTIARVRNEAERSLNDLDALRGDRRAESPWWRRPFFEDYGVGSGNDS